MALPEESEVLSWVDSLSNWGRWGDDDQLGTLNLITPDARRRAAAAVAVELPGISPARDNGWNSVYTSPCSGTVRQSFVPTSLDRADFNGFADYITAHSPYKVGVYSSAGVWASIFGTGSDSLIPHTYEWTYEPETTNYSGAYPYGWCLDHGAGPCAQFFGGQTSASPYGLMWQWSGGGGVTNGIAASTAASTRSTPPGCPEPRGQGRREDGASRPRARARSTASVRLCTPSFSYR